LTAWNHPVWKIINSGVGDCRIEVRSELLDAEWFRKPVDPFQKIFFPQILNTGDWSSTKVFHGEHFSFKTIANRAFHSLSTDVDIDLQSIRYPQCRCGILTLHRIYPGIDCAARFWTAEVVTARRPPSKTKNPPANARRAMYYY